MSNISNYATFILTNGRPNKQKTYQVLKYMNITSDIFLVIDDLDKYKKDYIKNFKDKIIVFDKKKEALNSDSVDNFNNMSTVLYARNFSIRKAKKMGYDFMVMVDDDISNISLRFPINNTLGSSKPCNIDNVYKSIFNYLKNSEIYLFAAGNSGGFFGGIDGKYKKGIDRKALNQMFFIDINKDVKFKGTLNEDYNVSVINHKKGNLMFELYLLCTSSPERGTNEGGLNNLYNKNSDYILNFYSIIVSPDISSLENKNNTIKLSTKWKFSAPKILREGFKNG